jgi:LuxR family maltose regulon positive regulatory protein
VALAEAIAHRELGERTRALAILDELAEAPSEALLYCRVLALIALTELRLDGGDVRKAERSLAAAADLSRAETFNAPVHDWVARTHASLALVRDDRSDAATWANAIADPFWRSLTTARVLLASGDKTAALTMVESADPSCPRHEVVVRLVRARVLTDRSAALEEVSAAVDIATRCGMLQTVASEGSEVLELVERVVNTPADWLDRLRRSATPTRRYEERQPDELIEPLTERERDVLRFLPSRLTLREIADELYVSVNTVKFHLRLIYRKLGVSSRVEAAEAARRMLSITQSPQ